MFIICAATLYSTSRTNCYRVHWYSILNLFLFCRFDIASRSGRGPPCGTRIVAGRIVKESYGAAKQQHTFTVSQSIYDFVNEMNMYF